MSFTCRASRADSGGESGTVPTGRRPSSRSARGSASRSTSWKGCRRVPLKQYKATSPVRRFRQSASFEELTKGKKPERSLTERKVRHAGRNAQGRVTTRHRGGGEKRNYRIVDFKRNKDGIPAKVTAIEYDPNRSARLALIVYRDGEKRYIIAPNDLRVGDPVISGPDAEARVGNCLPLEHIPTGKQINGIELQPGRGAQLVRDAGGAAEGQAGDGPKDTQQPAHRSVRDRAAAEEEVQVMKRARSGFAATKRVTPPGACLPAQPEIEQ